MFSLLATVMDLLVHGSFWKRGSMSNKGKTVTIHCAFSLKDGTLVEDTYKRNAPLQFVCERGAMIAGIVEAVEDMNVGDTARGSLVAAEAFGEYQEEYVSVLPVDQVSNGSALPIGGFVYLEEDGAMVPAKVVSIEGDMVTLDYNHPLAGKDFDFFIKLLSVEDAG